MDGRPMYLQGRGRGRGRAASSGRGRSPHSPPHMSSNSGDLHVGRGRAKKPNCSPTHGANNHGSYASMAHTHSHLSGQCSSDKPPEGQSSLVEDKFQDAALKHQKTAQRHLVAATDNYESSSEEEELNDEEIMESLLKSFKATSKVDSENDLGRTQEYLMNSVKSKANVCLICIETIKRNDPIWSCQGCFTMFHITCIQKWVKDGVYLQTAHLDAPAESLKTDLPWNCPKCRHDYKQSHCPTRYFCFCGKEEDPKFDPWSVPHSCGQVCGKRLKPECGHSCLLLCHPGPCPPCPQTVSTRCHCGRQSPKTRRCSSRQWSCGQPCHKELQCQNHTCQTPCHPADCPPCPATSPQTCRCGSQTTLRPCASPDWQCEKVCGKGLPCGHHTCEKVCHGDECGNCPRSENRNCPCGKTKHNLSCTEDVPTCLESCEKPLECGHHICLQRCHYGPCGTCREMTLKTCRCGKKQKDIQCFKEFLCEFKCSKMKDCNRHACKRKCCDDNCPSCDLPCNRTLACGNHKCASRCHKGRCYPCTNTFTLSCACGATQITVPCGREKVTRKPKCNQLCKKPPDCHHKERLPHKCHLGSCPACNQTCDKSLPDCGHRCPARCHAAVLTKTEEKVQRAGPWEAKGEVRVELVNKPCPPCQVPVPVSCLGKHETVKLPCSVARVASCHRPCGRALSCGNHVCHVDCHTVTGAPDELTAGVTCQQCEERCSKTRPEGCRHLCLLACHPGDCPPCEQMIRMRCHCQQLVLHIQCDQWSHADDTERGRLQSCHSKCPKMLSCGHQCMINCHPVACPKQDRCTERTKVRCPCRRKKRDFLCNEVTGGFAKLECDDVCLAAKEKQSKEKAEKEIAARLAATEEQKKELEDFERRIQGRRKPRRKQKQEEEPPSFLQRYGKFIIAPMLVLLLSVFVFYLLNK